MSRFHEEIQEESILLALGHTPDIPVITIVEHLAGCAECRQLMRDVSETAGRLPEALDYAPPPAHLRDNILRLAALDNEATAGQHRESALVADQPTRPTTLRSLLSWRLPMGSGTVAWAVALVLLIIGNGALWWHTQSQNVALSALQTQYASDLNWLQSAEYLLVSGEAPAYSGQLQRPETSQPLVTETAGRVAVYRTKQAQVYLIIQADGLNQATPHTVWIHEEGQKQLVGDFVSTPTGAGSYVYATDASEWERLTNRAVILGVRDESTQQPILVGTFGDPEANLSQKL